MSNEAVASWNEGHGLPVVPDKLVEVDVHSGQAVHCGEWPLVFRSGWAYGVVDEYAVVAIPRAPAWLRGAVNLDGSVVPVVDLVAYLQPAQGITPWKRNSRLLLGKKSDAPEADAVALLFTGLPFQLDFTRLPAQSKDEWPERLQDMCQHMAQATNGELWYEIDTDKLSQALLIHLM